jgi:hypothetical protein
MELEAVLKTLEYHQSSGYLSGSDLDSDPDYAHIFRKAKRDCSLHGAFILRSSEFGAGRGSIPVVYVCTAKTEPDALRIHRLVWNQNIVPFLIVISPAAVRLYPGFSYSQPSGPDPDPDAGALRALKSFADVAPALGGLNADAIHSGEIWRQWGTAVTPETRVDWQLLGSLEKLDGWLRTSGVEDRLLAHAVIGKFVYLHYLRERTILSDRKFEEWGIAPGEVFGRGLRLRSFKRLLESLDTWLNGSVFPIPDRNLAEFGEERLRQVAAVFQGDTIDGQLHLDFPAYDFSFIPIETLSVIYQQFLHSTESEGGASAGDARGAYYTPVPVVNLMLDRLDAVRPLGAGMRVLDPSCGSGAFLVQCYRRLIEERLRAQPDVPVKATELRRLLVESIYGFDVDEDACRIAEMSLILTLLEYISPPDLTHTNFKLPALSGRNIHRVNAFGDPATKEFEKTFDWVVGNPPWMALDPRNLGQIDRPVHDWIKENEAQRPTGGYQVAEAFCWRAGDFLATDGFVHLLLPAMTLFRNESRGFRREFLSANRLAFVANFANFSDILFAGRSEVPAASLLFSVGDAAGQEWVEVYSPFVANHPTSAPHRAGKRKLLWSLVINGSELRAVPYGQIRAGDALAWKIAMWGSPVDRSLIQRVRRRFSTIGDLEDKGLVRLAQGLELRTGESTEPTESHPELAGTPLLDVKRLKRTKYLFRFPKASIKEVTPEKTAVRKGRYRNAIQICNPPHVIVGEARTFAVLSDEFLVIPHPQIGIGSGDRRLLAALAAYLNTDFSYYYEFLLTAQAGIQKSITTLQSLRSLPVPFSDTDGLGPWVELQGEIEREIGERDRFDFGSFVDRLNELAATALGFEDRERWAVHDLVSVKMSLTRGKVGPDAVSAPTDQEVVGYGETLRAELDGFLDGDAPGRHAVQIIRGASSGMIEIALRPEAEEPLPVALVAASSQTVARLDAVRSRLIEKRADWLYFDRNLRVYEQDRTYVLKPLQRLEWTRTQAMIDAGDLIAEILSSDHASPGGVQ